MDLQTPLEKYFRLDEAKKRALKKLKLHTISDLLYYFPLRYGNNSEGKNISNVVAGEKVTVFGKVTRLKTSKGWKSKIPMSQAQIEDESGAIKAVWFHQPYIAKMLRENSFVRADGKVSIRKNELYLSNPKIENISSIPKDVGDLLFGGGKDTHTLYPVYPETSGISSLWLYEKIQKIFSSEILPTITDVIPDVMLAKYNLPTLKTALVWIHTPQKEEHALAARKRFAFEEVFFIQLQKKKDKMQWKKNPAYCISKSEEDIEDFVGRFPFAPTKAQQQAIKQILADFESGHAMSRLLEGDVGSGKTAVAATTAFAVVTSKPKGQDFGHLQVAYMAPTEILAKQHFESFIEYFTHLNISVGLITGKECRKFPSKTDPRKWTKISKPQLLKWVANGEIPILIGTHALIQKSVVFKHLAYSIIDEQHRFGTAQRQKITKKGELNPHLLSMTATPIPRTLALTVFGDLDLTLLDEMPLGRKPIITGIVMPKDRKDTYENIRGKLNEGRQVYVICPRIDIPDPEKPARLNDRGFSRSGGELAIIAKSVKEEARRLKKEVFPDVTIGILHSKMLQSEKEKVMQDFKAGKTHILVATSVVEVGVNVPNATVIIIEGAERFGLAQLHQLRGRVIRSNHQAYCYVFAETKTEKTVERLKAFQHSSNGFELAEFDLKLRGPGELSGDVQWGISDIGMEAIKNIKMVEAARAEAEHLLASDETLTGYPLIQKKLTERKMEEIHFE